ncbi:MAG: hypothetical protein JNK58_05885 [Phycisphaerae bacterium]|nr:hypothetical protein [Phycisphaerae bacterium]
MEFLPYAQVRRALLEHGVIEQIEGDRLGLVLQTTDSRNASPTATLHLGAADIADPRTPEIEPHHLGACAEKLLHRAHAAEFVLIPALRWRPILDATAFDLASIDDWREIDADAALHQNTREPLAMLARNRSLVRAIIDSLTRNADGPDCDLTIASLDAPLLIEWRSRGTLTLHCPEASAEGLLQSLRAT